MTAKDFYDLVVDMREAQKTYFKTRSREALTESKRIEKLIDDEIKRVNEIQKKR